VVNNNKVITISDRVEGASLNMARSIANALGLIFGPARLTAMIAIIVNMNDKPMQIRNGISNW